MKIMKYHPEQLCYWLEISGLFDNIKCSRTLGAVRLNYKGMEAFISASGKVTIRNAEKSDGENLMTLLSRCLWPAKYCMCNQPAIDCCRGTCNYCSDHVCEAVGGSYKTDGDFGRNITKRAGELVPVLNKISMLVDRFKEIADAVIDNSIVESKNFSEQYDEINKDVLNFMISAKKEEDASLGIFIAGIAANVKDSIDKVLMLEKTGIDRYDIGALTEARNIVVGAFNAFVTSNTVAAINITASHKSFEENNKNAKKGVIEIGNNGMQIAKLLSRQVPK